MDKKEIKEIIVLIRSEMVDLKEVLLGNEKELKDFKNSLVLMFDKITLQQLSLEYI